MGVRFAGSVLAGFVLLAAVLLGAIGGHAAIPTPGVHRLSSAAASLSTDSGEGPNKAPLTSATE